MLRQVAQRLAGTARRGISTSAIFREGEDKGPKGMLQHGVAKAASMRGWRLCAAPAGWFCRDWLIYSFETQST